MVTNYYIIGIIHSFSHKVAYMFDKWLIELFKIDKTLVSLKQMAATLQHLAVPELKKELVALGLHQEESWN